MAKSCLKVHIQSEGVFFSIVIRLQLRQLVQAFLHFVFDVLEKIIKKRIPVWSDIRARDTRKWVKLCFQIPGFQFFTASDYVGIGPDDDFHLLRKDIDVPEQGIDLFIPVDHLYEPVHLLKELNDLILLTSFLVKLLLQKNDLGVWGTHASNLSPMDKKLSTFISEERNISGEILWFGIIGKFAFFNVTQHCFFSYYFYSYCCSSFCL